MINDKNNDTYRAIEIVLIMNRISYDRMSPTVMGIVDYEWHRITTNVDAYCWLSTFSIRSQVSSPDLIYSPPQLLMTNVVQLHCLHEDWGVP